LQLLFELNLVVISLMRSIHAIDCYVLAPAVS